MKGSFKKEERRGLPGGPNEMFTYTTGVFSTQGYKADSPDVDNPFNIIPSGDITMDGVEFPVHGVDNLGNSSIMLPGNDYEFPGDMVLERPRQDLSLKSNPSRKEVLGYGFAFPEQREGNFIAGAGLNFLPIGTQFSAVGVLPMQSNPVFKGVGSLNASKQVGDFNIGIGANKDFINDYETGDRVKTPIKPSFNVKYTKTFQDGGSTNIDLQKQFFKDYLSSPEYKERLIAQGYDNSDEIIKNRLANLDRVYVGEGTRRTVIEPNTGEIAIGSNEAASSYLPDYLAHEVGHTIGGSFPVKSKKGYTGYGQEDREKNVRAARLNYQDALLLNQKNKLWQEAPWVGTTYDIPGTEPYLYEAIEYMPRSYQASVFDKYGQSSLKGGYYIPVNDEIHKPIQGNLSSEETTKLFNETGLTKIGNKIDDIINQDRKVPQRLRNKENKAEEQYRKRKQEIVDQKPKQEYVGVKKGDEHYVGATESYADLQGFRYYAYRELGIKPTDTMTPELFNKVINHYNTNKQTEGDSILIDRILEKYKPEDFVEITNTIAYNPMQNQNLDMAQDGGDVNELPKAQFGLNNSLTPFTGSDLSYERQYVKENYGNPNKEVADKVLAYMKLIEEADAKQKALDFQKEEEAYLEKFVPASDNTRVETRAINPLTPEEKIKELEDKLTRTFAEMENQRRRFEKEKDDAFDYGGFSFAKEALNLIDNLERSKQILESDEVLKDTEALKKTLEHFEIISKDMVSIFSKNGITPVVSIGKKLDPNQHQAMMEIDDDQKEPGTIVQEIQKGFMMKDRLLRPALVGVSKKTKTPDDQKSEENKENSDN